MRAIVVRQGRWLGAVVAGALLTGALLAVAVPGDGSHRAVWPMGVLTLATGVGALGLWQTRPGPVLAITAVTAVVYYLAGFPPGPETVPFVVALVAVAAGGRRVLAACAALLAVVVAAGADLLSQRPESLDDLAAVAGSLAAVVALAEVYRLRRARLALSHERAVQAERLRIARELHDVLSHQLSMINLQAEAALARRATRPELAATALEIISTASREALRDIRATLGAVRDRDGAVLDAPGSLSDLPALAGRLRTAGVEVTVTVPDPPGSIPAPVERALVRIARESLANAARHARPRRIAITVAYEPGTIRLEVVNDGIRAAAGTPGGGVGLASASGGGFGLAGASGGGVGSVGASGAGIGLAGMRERAEALGGRLDAGADGDGRFRVRASLPWKTAS